MITKFSIKEVTYLLGCYIIIADREINQLEVDFLDSIYPLDKDDDLYKERLAIFSDEEDCIKEKSLIYKLRLLTLTDIEKNKLLRFVVQVAYADDFVSNQERQIIDNVSTALEVSAINFLNEEEANSERRIKSEQLSGIERAIGQVESFLYDNFAGKNKSKTTDRLLRSLAYSTALEKITKTATVNLSRVSRIMNSINMHLTNTYNEISNTHIKKGDSSKEVQEVAKLIEETANHFKELIHVSLQENIEVLEKKRRNIKYFTIAFMGRTKAGKSTMHKVITQQENDDIGIGQLRTTRYNRSWYWEKLRIVDTPGIGAPGGETDTEIAKSIIDEADIICYVVTSDSIQETEFDFFDTIKERNKPLYIILNVKSNLNQEIRLKRFVSSPDSWRTTDGQQSISGHIERIHDKLDGKYNMSAVEIIPIHLLAAQIGISHKYGKDISKKLIEGSNIMEFIRTVKKEVHSSGNLKKSLSIIDGTSYQIHSISKTIANDSAKISEAIEILDKKTDKFQKFISSESSRLQNDIKTIFKSAKAELYNRASSFASEHYNDDNAGKHWQDDSVVKSIFSRLSDKLKTRMEDFNEKVKSEMDEIASDILFCMASGPNSSGIKGISITNTRLGAGIVGSILAAAAPILLNLPFWIVAIGGSLVVSFLTSLFTSKATKIRRATGQLKRKLEENIDQSIKENQEEALKNTNKSVSDMYNSINAILTTYIINSRRLVNNLNELQNNCKDEEAAINSLLGIRILDYVGKSPLKDSKIDSLSNNDLANRYPVKRDWKEQSLKYLYQVKLKESEKVQAEHATQMNIIFK